MFLKRKLTVMATTALLATSLLAGCSSTDTSDGGEVTSRDVLANENARIAIAKAIDKQSFCDVILNNGSEPTDIFTPPDLAFDDGKDYVELLEGAGHSHDKDEAKEAWELAKEEVGFDNITLELVTYDHDSGKRASELLQGELTDTLDGLEIEIVSIPFAQKLEKESAGDFDLAYSGWGADYPDPLTFLKTMETGGQFANQVGYESDEFNSMMKEAKTLSTTEAYAKYSEAEAMMLDEAFIVPLYNRGRTYLQKPEVSGILAYSWGADYSYLDADVDRDEKVLNLDISADIPTLDVSKATDTVSFTVMNNTMEGLTRVDEDGNVEPAVAESWDVSEDGLTWTFNLRDDSTWSNGESVTAHDFEYSWKRTLDPNTASEYAYIMNDIAGAAEVAEQGLDGVGVTAVDDYTLEIELTRQVEYLPELVSFQIFFPQNQAFVEAQGDNYGLSVDGQLYNGPFTLSAWSVENQYTMTKSDSYWNADRIKLDTINTKVVKETSSSVNLYEAGEIDRVILDSEYVEKYKGHEELDTYTQAVTFMLQVNGGN